MNVGQMWVVLVLTASVASEPPQACSLDSPIDALNASLGLVEDEAALLSRGGCGVVNPVEEEACLCAAMRRGWHEATRAGLRQRLLRRQPSPTIRKMAQTSVDAMQVLLGRLNPKYPKNLRFVPALEYRESADAISVRVRHARYPRADPLFSTSDGIVVLLSDAELHYAAEGLDKPGYAETTLRWLHPLRRRDGCMDHEEGCEEWAAGGACAELPAEATGAPTFAERCPRSCGVCPPANGTQAVVAAWVTVAGGLVFEARKAREGLWGRLLATGAAALNRVAEAPVEPPVGTLLECVEGCASELCDGARGRQTAAAADGGGCLGECREACAAEVAGRYAFS